MSHFRRWSPSGSGTARGGESNAKADCISEYVSGMSRRTKARPARLYRERKVALVDVCAVGDVCIEIGVASCVEFAPNLRGICGTNEFFATVVTVAVGIGLSGRDGGQDSAGRAPANHFTWTGLFTHVTAEIYTPTYRQAQIMLKLILSALPSPTPSICPVLPKECLQVARPSVYVSQRCTCYISVIRMQKVAVRTYNKSQPQFPSACFPPVRIFGLCSRCDVLQ